MIQPTESYRKSIQKRKVCILCHSELDNLKILGPAGVPFCDNVACPRFGLLTVAYDEGITIEEVMNGKID